eukprot:TRINITY_DN507_c1_g1_i18.p4 TRINITY_DN507_c1_g1~~TRINITY_DN507_c1_g1_i18.p4  ORF type:complete len:107 (-),score=7.67 TRINITY_DN507_c1_g1_i18:390-710(-)
MSMLLAQRTRLLVCRQPDLEQHVAQRERLSQFCRSQCCTFHLGALRTRSSTVYITSACATRESSATSALRCGVSFRAGQDLAPTCEFCCIVGHVLSTNLQHCGHRM